VDSKSHYRVRPPWSNKGKNQKKDGCHQLGHFGHDDGAPGPGPVIIPGSPAEYSATSDDENSPSSVKTKGKLPLRELLSMQQQLKDGLHLKRI
jgi:hypothetical protein